MELILEVANTHGGNPDYITSLIDELSYSLGQLTKTKKNGIKFQPFTAEGISCPDFSAHDLYKKLEINNETWMLIIDRAHKSFNVWLDMFDLYSVNVLKNNFKKIFGIKMQSSTLRNYEIRASLSKLDLSNINLVVNCAGLSIEELEKVIPQIQLELKPKKLIIQVGYQAYPTSMIDSGLQKINILKSKFNNKISFADHEDSSDFKSLLLPMIAVSMGCEYIEKHVMHSYLETTYDYHSSFKVDRICELLSLCNSYYEAIGSNFIVSSEAQYLKKSYQKPVAKINLEKGSLINLAADLSYKRTDEISLSIEELEELIKKDIRIARDISIGEVISRKDFD